MAYIQALFLSTASRRVGRWRAKFSCRNVITSITLIIALLGLPFELAYIQRILKHSYNPYKTTHILENWCASADKLQTTQTDQECMNTIQSNINKAIESIKTHKTGTLFFKHVHKAGGTTLCQLAQLNMIAEDVALPFRHDWTTNCVPYEAFLGAHPAVGGGGTASSVIFSNLHSTKKSNKTTISNNNSRRRLTGAWLGGACFMGFLTPAQLRVLPNHYKPLDFIASEGPLPNSIPIQSLSFAMMTMLRDPLDRMLSSYKWWQFMTHAMPHSPAECRAYSAPNNATFDQWLDLYPDNWMTREFAGTDTLYKRTHQGKPKPLTRDDVLRAKQRLHYFAAVLILEKWKDSMMLMQNIFGWDVEDDDEAYRAGSRQNTSARVELEHDRVVLQKLKDKNVYDVELYEYALKLHQQQVIKYI